MKSCSCCGALRFFDFSRDVKEDAEVFTQATMEKFDTDAQMEMKEAERAHVLYFHHEIWEACVDGYFTFLMTYFSLLFLGVPKQNICVVPFERTWGTCKAVMGKMQKSFKAVNFYFLDCVPIAQKIEGEMVAWFNSMIEQGGLKVWLLDHHKEALTFASSVRCSAFYPGELTNHSGWMPIGAAGSEPSSFTAYQKFLSLKLAGVPLLAEVEVNGVMWSYEKILELFKVPCAKAALSDMLIFATTEEVNTFIEQNILPFFNGDRMQLEMCMLFQDKALQKVEWAKGGVFVTGLKDFYKNIDGEDFDLVEWSTSYATQSIQNIVEKYPLLFALGEQVETTSASVFPEESIATLLKDAEEDTNQTFQRGLLEYASSMWNSNLRMAKEIAKAYDVPVMVNEEYTLAALSGNPSTMGRFFAAWMEKLMGVLAGIDTNELPLLVLFIGHNGNPKTTRIARLSGRFFPQPKTMKGGDWIVLHDEEILSAFCSVKPGWQDYWTISKACSYGSGGTVFLEPSSDKVVLVSVEDSEEQLAVTIPWMKTEGKNAGVNFLDVVVTEISEAAAAAGIEVEGVLVDQDKLDDVNKLGADGSISVKGKRKLDDDVSGNEERATKAR